VRDVAKKIEGQRFEDAAKAYLRTRKVQVKHNTWRLEESTLNAVRRVLGGNHWVSSLDEDFWWDYFYGDEGRSTTLSAGAFNGDRRRCQSFVDFCVRRGWMAESVREFFKSDVKTRKETKRQRMILTPAQLIELPEHAAYPSHRVALAIGANTALRGSEIMGIKLGKVYLDRGEMLVQLWKTDTEVMVPITSRLAEEIKRWLEVYAKTAEEQGLGPLQPEWYLVPSQRPGRLREEGSSRFTASSPSILRIRPEQSPTQPHKIVQLALDKMGLEYEKGEGFHTTRRGFARAFYDGLVAAGDPNALRKTSALLHHANTTMTERYLGLNSESVAVTQTLRGQDFLGKLVGDSP
jgi:integrase